MEVEKSTGEEVYEWTKDSLNLEDIESITCVNYSQYYSYHIHSWAE